MNTGASEARPESVDIKEYIAILLKRKWLILVCFLLSMAGTTAFLFTRQPVYRATAKMLVDKSGGALPVQSISREDDDTTFFSTQINIIYSVTMQQRVMQRFKRTVEEVRDNLRNFAVNQVGGSQIILISVDSPSKEFARDYANAVAEEYLKFRDERRAEGAESALLMLTREINRLSQELKSANERVIMYIKEHNLAGVEQLQRQQYQNVLSAMTAAATRLADVQMRKKMIESQPNAANALAILAADRNAPAANEPTTKPEPAAALDSGTLTLSKSPEAALPAADAAVESDDAGGPQPLTLSVNHSALWSFNEAQAQRLFQLDRDQQALKSQLETLSKHYRARHPLVQETAQRLARTQEAIASLVEMVKQKTDADLKLAQAGSDSLKAQFDALNATSLRDNSQAMEYRTMRQTASRYESLYNTLLGKLMTIDVSQNFRERNVSILEQAIVYPDPVYPKKAKGMIVAAFLGLGLGLALAFFIEYIDDSIKLAEEVERDLQLPFLGMIPAAQWNPEDLSAHRLDKLKQQGGVAEAYRVVRSAIIFSIPREKLRSILVTSAVPREGKTTTCINMAIGFSQVEDRVLLVDADLRRGEIQKYFGLERGKGLVDVLLGESTPDEVIKHTEVPKLDVMTCGAYPANPAELLLGWRFKEFLEWAYKHYTRIVVDCPPVMGIADSAILGSVVDGVMLIIWAGRTSRRYVRVAKMTAVSRGAKIFGFMLNNLEPGRVGYYHYYPYYYSYYSRGYYYVHKDEDEAKGVAATPGDTAVAAKTDDDDSEIDDVY